MKYRDLLKISMDNYRKNGFVSHVIFFFLSLFAAAFLLLCLFYVDLFLLIIPLIVIPIFFACQVVVILLREEDYLTFRGFLNCFRNYFTSKFASTFRVIRSALWSFLVYIAFYMIYGISINLSFYATNFMNYQSVYGDILNTMSVSIADLEAVVQAHRDFFEIILIYTNVPALYISAVFFIALIGINAIGLFDRLNNMSEPGRLHKVAHANLLINYRKEMYLSFFKLNWPLFLLFFIGFGGGAVIGYFTLHTYNGVYTLGIVLGVLVAFGLFGPFFLANNEAIYISFKERYLDEKNKLKGQLATSLEEMIKQLEDKKDQDSGNED